MACCGSSAAALIQPDSASLYLFAGRGRKSAVEDAAVWDWQHGRQQMLVAVHEIMRVELKLLFKGLAAAERMINLCLEMVGTCRHAVAAFSTQFQVCQIRFCDCMRAFFLRTCLT